MNKKEIYKKVFLNIICLIVIILALKFLLPYLFSLFLPFILGYIIAIIAEPLVKFLENKIKIKRKHSTIFIIIGVLAGIIGIIYCVCRQIYSTILNVLEDTPEIISRINGISDKLNSLLQHNNTQTITQISEIITKFIDTLSKNITNYGTNIISHVPMFIFIAFITFLSAYFMIKENFQIKISFLENNKKYKIIKANIIDVTIGFLKGQFKIMFVIFIILTFGFGILGIKYFILVALLVAFVDLLPIFGTGTILCPWILISILEGNYGYAIALIILYIITFLTRQLMQPKVISKSIGLEPLPTLLFMFIGFKIWGFGGLIFAPPIGLILIKLNELGLFDNYKKCLKIIIRDIKENISIDDIDKKGE